MVLQFGDDRFRGSASAEGHILSFPIDFDGRPYNAFTLPCERVIQHTQSHHKVSSSCFTNNTTQSQWGMTAFDPELTLNP